MACTISSNPTGYLQYEKILHTDKEPEKNYNLFIPVQTTSVETSKKKSKDFEKVIKSLKIVGETIIFNKETKTEHPVKILKEKGLYDLKIYHIVSETKEGFIELGFMKLDMLSIKGDFVGSTFHPFVRQGENVNQYHVKNENYKETISKAFIQDMIAWQNKSYKGIGTALMQIAIEKSFKYGFEGRLMLDAARNSHGFHYLMGLRTFPLYFSERDEIIKDELEKAKKENREPITSILGSFYMYLPIETIETKWKKQIQEKPLLFKTRLNTKEEKPDLEETKKTTENL